MKALKNPTTGKITVTGWIAVIVPVLTAAFSAFAYVDNRYETKTEAKGLYEELNYQVAMGDYSVEQSLLQLRLDVIEERLLREEGRPTPDREKIKRWSLQMERIEKRYQLIDEKMLDLQH